MIKNKILVCFFVTLSTFPSHLPALNFARVLEPKIEICPPNILVEEHCCIRKANTPYYEDDEDEEGFITLEQRYLCLPVLGKDTGPFKKLCEKVGGEIFQGLCEQDGGGGGDF